MSDWSLEKVLETLHNDIERRLAAVRESFGHSTTMGDASEQVWLQLLQTYLPQRYAVEKAFVVDSRGAFSDQVDIAIFDRQYSPFIFKHEGQKVVPAESVYAVFEAKQAANARQIRYAQAKVASVRSLHRTSLPIPHAGGTYPAKIPGHILGGLLTFASDWNPPLGESLVKALDCGLGAQRLDLGCIAANGTFSCDETQCLVTTQRKPATAFLLELIARLQSVATVPMIDVRAYAKWLD